MIRIGGKAVYLACGGTDMRKGINGLAAMVEGSFNLDPFDGALFVFCNKARDTIKMLEWDGDGYWVHMKRLERGHFKWPIKDETAVMCFTDEELTILIGGTKIERKIRRETHIGRQYI